MRKRVMFVISLTILFSATPHIAKASPCHILAGDRSQSCAEGPCTNTTSGPFIMCRNVECEAEVGCPRPTGAAREAPTIEYHPVQAKLQINIPNLEFSKLPEKITPGETLSIPWIAQYIAAVFRWAVRVGAVLAVIMIMVGGVIWMTSGATGALSKAKEMMTNAVIGLILLVGSYTTLYLINPDLITFRALQIKTIIPEFISTENSGDVITSDDLAAPSAGTNGIPMYKQGAFEQPYGRCGTIKSSGCGPTSMAMVLQSYGVNADPLLVANTFAEEGYRACPPDSCNCNGTAHTAFTNSKLLAQAGLVGEQLGNTEDRVMDILIQNDRPVIAVVNKEAIGIHETKGLRHFTNGGHYIVLTGVDADGNILVNDPAQNITITTPDLLFPGLKNAWTFRPQ